LRLKPSQRGNELKSDLLNKNNFHASIIFPKQRQFDSDQRQRRVKRRRVERAEEEEEEGGDSKGG